MRAITFVLFVVLWLPAHSTAPPQEVKPADPEPALTEPGVDWARDIAPIFAARCQPCHFPGGKMHERLPFDKPETIRKLRTKVFSRIRDEKQRELIRAFLARN